MTIFDNNKHLKTVADIEKLAMLLAECPEVRRFDAGKHNESWSIADSFGELEKSMRQFVDEILPRLVRAEPSVTEIEDILFDVAEEFRKIHFHMFEAQHYFRFVVPYTIEDCEDESAGTSGNP